MSVLIVKDQSVNEDGSAYCLARVKKVDSSNNKVIVATSDFDSISRGVFRKSDGTQILAPTNLTIADVILAALSTGTIWTKDATGFNFKDLLPVTAFPTGGDVVVVEYKFTMTAANGSAGFPLIYEFNVNALWSS